MQNKQGGDQKGPLSDKWKKLLGSALSSTRDSQDYRRISRFHSVIEIIRMPLRSIMFS
jgi:hypothetical protein